ncbi:MAG: hypothetical protein AAB534_02805 [Patescibacteria group bacterium]
MSKLQLAFVGLVLFLFSLSFWAGGSAKDGVIYSPTYQLDFWEKNVKPIVSGIVAGKCDIQEVQERYDLLVKEVVRKYSTYKINLVTTYHPKSRFIYFASSNREGKATIDIFLPTQLDVWDEVYSSGESNWREQFRCYVIVAFLHEMEHLAGDPPYPGEEKDNRNSLVACESMAWARTVEHTVAPMVEKHQLPVSKSDRNYYDYWRIGCERDANHPAWESFIRDIYGHLRDH